jgi:hypothetical protein
MILLVATRKQNDNRKKYIFFFNLTAANVEHLQLLREIWFREKL